MGCKECIGRYGLIVSAVIFTLGVLVSSTTPSWISTIIDNPITGFTQEIEFGPFYSRNRNCSYVADATTGNETAECSDWETKEMENDDCESFSGDADVAEKICRQHNTWRILAMLCFIIVVGTGIMVLVATLTQCVTCGCCGGSFDMIAMIAYWLEVVLSIVCWSFCISVVTIIQDVDFLDLATEEAENIAGLTKVDDLVNGSFLWGFWLFIFTGTIMGAVCATLADWAAENSCLRLITNCVACLFCCKK